MYKCSKCKAKLDGNSNFCQCCGTAVDHEHRVRKCVFLAITAASVMTAMAVGAIHYIASKN